MTLAVRTIYAVIKSKFSGKILIQLRRNSYDFVSTVFLVYGKLMGFSWRPCNGFSFLFNFKIKLRTTKNEKLNANSNEM